VKGLLLQTWQRLKGFILRAGKAIVLVVIVLNTVNSLGTDGSLGNQNTEKSLLSAIGRAITPVFAPIGITDDNWPATVGLFTGIFAKEVVVGTLDALYAPDSSDATVDLRATLIDALQTVPDNLRAIGDQLTDPLGLDLGDLSDSAAAAEAQAIAQGTLGAMRTLFPNGRAAFAYLLFVLLYMPCVATLGVIFKEQGAFWAVFSAGWSFTIAYSSAVIAYQLPTVLSQPVVALGWTGAAVALAAAILTALVRYGRQREARLIPVLRVD
jgi:ferrous iron transport protein B